MSSGLVWSELRGEARERAVPVPKEGFEGYYRWHAKRTLGRVPWVWALVDGERVAGITLLDAPAPGLGYVYYVAVARSHRRRGVGQSLVRHAVEQFRVRGDLAVVAAAEEDNVPSRRLFQSQGFRVVARDEPSYREGGLGIEGLRTRMTILPGEVVLGLRLQVGSRAPPDPPEPARRGALGRLKRS